MKKRVSFYTTNDKLQYYFTLLNYIDHQMGVCSTTQQSQEELQLLIGSQQRQAIWPLNCK
jgi:hypothetical protein